MSEDKFQDLLSTKCHVVLWRNHYVHGCKGVFDNQKNFMEFAFTTNTLEFVPRHIDKITSTVEKKRVIPSEFRWNELKKEGYNLNISRYISKAVAEEEINLQETHAELVSLGNKIRAAAERHNEFLKELGLPLLP